jgi:alpha-tubulin suppressor-like RCC1 family protein
MLLAPVCVVSAQVPRTNSVSLSLGEDFCLLVKNDGTVLGWGSNLSGQIELGKAAYLPPTKIKGLENMTSLDAGFNTAIGIAQNGEVFVWGGGMAAPAKVSGLNGIVKVKAYIGNFMALASDGTLYAWSADSKPTKLVGLPTVVDIAAGDSHCLILTSTGHVYAMGENYLGQLGNGVTGGAAKPERIDSLADIVNVGAGANHSFAITKAGRVYAWGHNADGQLGLGVSSPQVVSPRLIDGLLNVAQIDGGAAHSVALDADGKVYVWGRGTSGQLGPDEDKGKDVPQAMNAGIKAEAVAAGGNSTFVMGGGAARGFGRLGSGQDGASGGSELAGIVGVAGDVRTTAKYVVDVFGGASAWAKDDIQAMYANCALPLAILHDFKGNITRAEFAALLVAAYEFSRGREASTFGGRSFVDIANHPFEADVKKANSLGIVDGISNTAFGPDDYLTREQAAKMLANAYGIINEVKIPTFNYSKLVFADGKNVSAWAAPFISFVIDRRVMQGVSEMEFLPKGNLTREAAIVTAKRIALR